MDRVGRFVDRFALFPILFLSTARAVVLRVIALKQRLDVNVFGLT